MTSSSPETISGSFAVAAARRPTAIALSHGTRHYTYAELDRASDALAASLWWRGVRPGDFASLIDGRSVALVTGLIATLKIGGAYSVVDPSWPQARVQRIVDRLRPSVVLVNGGPTIEGKCWSALPDVDELLNVAPAPFEPHRARSSDPACVFFTSGSSGEPKGVVSPHAGVVRLFTGERAIFDDTTVMALAAPVSWDAFSLELWGTLLAGGRLVIEGSPFLDGAGLRAMTAQGVNTVWLGASLFNLVVDEDVEAFQGLRHVLSGGERLSPSHVKAFLDRHPEMLLTNGYGPVESTIFATTHRVTLADCDRERGIPIGRPVPETEVFVLRDGHRCRPGEEGELWIASTGLATSYLDDPRATAQAFRDIEVDGRIVRAYGTGDIGTVSRSTAQLEFIGRADRQIKLRGYRIEPEEIRATLISHPDVTDAAIVPILDEQGRRRGLVAFVSCARSDVTGVDLRAFIAGQLPSYLVPARIEVVEALPMLATGKVDWWRLDLLAATLGEGAAMQESPDEAEDDIVRTILGIVHDVGLRPASWSADMLAGGANSLDVGRVCARIGRRLGVVIALSGAAADFSVNGLAAQTRCALASDPKVTVDLGPPGAPVPLRDIQVEFLLANQITSDVAANCAFGWWVAGPLDEGALGQAVIDVFGRLDSLRGRYVLSDPPAMLPASDGARPGLNDLGVVATDHEALERLQSALMSQLHLSDGEIWRAVLVKSRESARELFGLVAHHIAWDGTAEILMVKDLGDAYASRRTGTEPELDPRPSMRDVLADYLHQRDVADVSTEVAYWQTELDGAPTLDFGLPRSEPEGSASLDAMISQTDVAICDEIAARIGTTRFAVLLSSFAGALAAVSGQSDLVIGLPVTKRSTERMQQAVTCLIDVIPLRLSFDREGSALDDLMATSAAVRSGLTASTVSLSEIVRATNPPRRDRPPLFQAMFTIEPEDDLGLRLVGCDLTFLRFDPPKAMTEIGCALWPQPDGSYRAHFIHGSARVAASTASAIATTMVRVLGDYVALLPEIGE